MGFLKEETGSFDKYVRDLEDYDYEQRRDLKLGFRGAKRLVQDLVDPFPDVSKRFDRDLEDTKEKLGHYTHKTSKFISRTFEDHPFLAATGAAGVAALAGLGAYYYKNKKKD